MDYGRWLQSNLARMLKSSQNIIFINYAPSSQTHYCILEKKDTTHGFYLIHVRQTSYGRVTVIDIGQTRCMGGEV